MEKTMKFTFTEDPSEEEIAILSKGIADDVWEIRNTEYFKPFAIFHKNEDGIILAGCNGMLLFGSLYVDQLWVDKQLRHQGIGSSLMKKIEAYARQTSCVMITLNTMDWQALPFYQKLGFKIDFERSGYQSDSKMFFLSKYL